MWDGGYLGLGREGKREEGEGGGLGSFYVYISNAACCQLIWSRELSNYEFQIRSV